jgi:hypothetical protein
LLRNVGVYDAALPFMKQVPMKTQVSVTTLGAQRAQALAKAKQK